MHSAKHLRQVAFFLGRKIPRDAASSRHRRTREELRPFAGRILVTQSAEVSVSNPRTRSRSADAIDADLT